MPQRTTALAQVMPAPKPHNNTSSPSLASASDNANGIDAAELLPDLSRVATVRAVLRPVHPDGHASRRGAARGAVEAGARRMNEASGTLWPVARATGAGWVAMHMQGGPTDMQADPHYDDVFAEVRDFLHERAAAATAAGVAEVWIDPGFGFGKTVAPNMTLMARLTEFCAGPYPVLAGMSRKSTLGALTPDPDGSVPGPTDRLEASIAATVWAATKGVSMVRVHDVAATVAAVRIVCDEVPVSS